jgi:hypothetical protein
MPTISAYLVARSRLVYMVDLRTSTILNTFQTESMAPRSLRFFHSAKRHGAYGLTGLGYFGLAYTNAETGECVIHTYTPPQDDSCINANEATVNAARGGPSCTWQETLEVKRRVDNPGVWEALPNGSIVGVRRRKPPSQPAQNGSTQSGLRRRVRHVSPNGIVPAPWEVWSLSQLDRGGECEHHPLLDELEGDYSTHLLVSQLGPLVTVGTSSVALGFGNVVKVITVGQEHYGSVAEILEADNIMTIGSRRRRTVGMARARARSQS